MLGCARGGCGSCGDMSVVGGRRCTSNVALGAVWVMGVVVCPFGVCGVWCMVFVCVCVLVVLCVVLLLLWWWCWQSMHCETCVY